MKVKINVNSLFSISFKERRLPKKIKPKICALVLKNWRLVAREIDV